MPDSFKDDDFFDDLRPSRRMRIGFALWFAFCALLGVTVLGVFVWAVINLVTWVTSQ